MFRRSDSGLIIYLVHRADSHHFRSLKMFGLSLTWPVPPKHTQNTRSQTACLFEFTKRAQLSNPRQINLKLEMNLLAFRAHLTFYFNTASPCGSPKSSAVPIKSLEIWTDDGQRIDGPMAGPFNEGSDLNLTCSTDQGELLT